MKLSELELGERFMNIVFSSSLHGVSVVGC